MKGHSEHRHLYRGIGQRLKRSTTLNDLEQRTLLNHLIRLPEAYKLDFISVHLGVFLQKADNSCRDLNIYQHYRHYVSLPSLAGLLSALRESQLDFGNPIVQLLEHIRNLQLVPGSSSKEREAMEKLQFDLLHLLQLLQKDREHYTVDLSSESARIDLAERYYDRIMSSFISESDDQLISEDAFIDQLKRELLKSDNVQTFASRYSQEIGEGRSVFLKQLGALLSQTIATAYAKNYEGIFNGPKEMVLKLFLEAIENRCLDCETPNRVDLEAVSSSILAIVLELVFNDGFGAFRQTLTQTLHHHLLEDTPHG